MTEAEMEVIYGRIMEAIRPHAAGPQGRAILAMAFAQLAAGTLIEQRRHLGRDAAMSGLEAVIDAATEGLPGEVWSRLFRERWLDNLDALWEGREPRPVTPQELASAAARIERERGQRGGSPDA